MVVAGGCDDHRLFATLVSMLPPVNQLPDIPRSRVSLAPALVHDYLLVYRGAERTFAQIAACWPGAPVATLVYDKRVLGPHLGGHPIRTSRLQRLSIEQQHFRRLLPLYPAAASRLPVGGHDVVISSSSAFAHGVQADAGAVHLCYCHTPFRYAWFERERAATMVPVPLRPALAVVMAQIRRWDLEASQRVTHYVANSEFCRERISRIYGREAQVIYPPVDTARFEITDPEDFFLVVTELVRHKNVEVALEAARRSRCRIKVVGTGPDLARLQALHGDHAEFLGRISDAELATLLPRSLALVVPNVEEFGIAAVEAQAAGRPVIAADAGGTRETILDGETGVLLREIDVRTLSEVMKTVEFTRFRARACVENAERFSQATFRAQITKAVLQAAAERDR